MRKLVVIVVSLILLVSLAGCGPFTNPHPVLTSITVTPGEPFVVVNGTQQFTAAATDQFGHAFTADFSWSVEPSSMGVITLNGLFTAGSTTGNCVVRCTSGSKSCTATVTIIASSVPELTNITVAPGEPFVAVNGTQQFTATATDQFGHAFTADFSWSVEPSSMGAITQDGLFSAGTVTGNCTVRCTSGSKTSTASVTLIKNSADLHQAGQQIIDDTQKVWNKLYIKMQNLYDTIKDNDLKSINYGGSALFNTYYYGIDFYLYSLLFQLPPSETPYYYYDVCEETSPGSIYDFNEGTWTVDFDEGWSIRITRTVDGANDNIHVEIKNEDIPALNYQVDLVYNTTFLIDPDMESSGTVNITMEDNYINTSTVSGTINSNLTNFTGFVDGDANFDFKDGNYIKFQGEFSVQHSTDQQDNFNGSFETANILINGDLTVDYVANPNVEGFEVFPNKLTINGSAQDKSTDPIILDSTLTVEIMNAATFNPLEDYSFANWAHGKINFDGSVRVDENNSFSGAVALEETAYNRYNLNVDYQLTNEGVQRELNLIVYNTSNTALHLEIDSSWGPALVVMDAHFDSNISSGDLSSVSGHVYVHGIQVGTISLWNSMIRVDYNDGTFETF